MKIVCLMGKSGCGKSTIEAQLNKIGYNRIISYTSRKPRGSEKNGVEYHFVTKEEFEGLIKKNILMEYAIYNGNYYGAPKPIGSINNVIVVERHGYEKIKELYGSQAIGVYISIDDEELNTRIKNRNDTSELEAHNRHKEDEKLFVNIEDIADIVIDARLEPDVAVMKILSQIKEIENARNKSKKSIEN